MKYLKDMANFVKMTANSANTPKKPRLIKKTLNVEQLKDLKSKSRCKICKKIGHWACDDICPNRKKNHSSDNNDGGSSIKYINYQYCATKKTGILNSNMVNLQSPLGNFPNSVNVDNPCVDDGAPCSGLAEVEADKLFSYPGL